MFKFQKLNILQTNFYFQLPTNFMPTHGMSECSSANAGAFWHFAFRLLNKRLQAIYNWIYHKYMRIKSQIEFIVKFCRVCVFVQLTILEMGSFAYGIMQINKNCMHGGFGSTFSLKCCKTFYHIRTARTHTFRHVVKHTDNVQWYGDVTVEHSVLIHWSTFGCVHIHNAMTYTFIAPSSVYLYLFECNACD